MNTKKEMSEVDFKYSFDLLERINNSKFAGALLRDYCADEAYMPWTTQQFFLFNHIKDFSKSRSFSVYSRERIPRLSCIRRIFLFLFNIFVLCISCGACMLSRIRHTSVCTFSSDILASDIPISHRLYTVCIYLKQNSFSYLEIVHTTTAKNLFVNMWRRRKIVVYYETVAFLATFFSFLCGIGKKTTMRECINLDNFTEFEYDFVKYITVRALDNIKVNKIKEKILCIIMKASGTKTFISIDDPRFVDDIIRSCRHVGIKTHIFQHSNFDYRIGLDSLSPKQYVFPDFFYFWNEYWLERAPEISPIFKANIDKCSIGGRAYKFTHNAYQHTPPLINIKENLNVLIPYEVALSSIQISPYIKALMNDKRIRIFFTPRSDFPRELQIRKYFGDSLPNDEVIFFEKSEFFEIIPKIHLVAGVYSGYLDEMIEMCVPVAILNIDYPCINRLDHAGMAKSVDIMKGNIYEQLSNIALTPQNILEKRKNYMSRGTPHVSDTMDTILPKLPNETIYK